MRILAIESSAVTASVAILTDDVLTAEYTVNYKKTHSQTLLPMIDEICKMTETEPESFDLIAVSQGPGSFTGLRIGAATGKGIALALDKKMVAVPTLKAMAYNVSETDCLICPVMDARRQHLYTALYRLDKDGKPQEVLAQSLLSYEELIKLLNEKMNRYSLSAMVLYRQNRHLKKALPVLIKSLRRISAPSAQAVWRLRQKIWQKRERSFYQTHSIRNI